MCSHPSLYVWSRHLLERLRDVELKAGSKAVPGQKGAAHAYNIKSRREEERRWVEDRFLDEWNG
jgi:transposase